MKTFTANPIMIRNEGVMVGVLELGLDCSETEFVLEVKGESGKLLFKDMVDEDTLLAFDLSEVTLTLNYYKPHTSNLILSQHFNLFDEFAIHKDQGSGKMLDLKKQESSFQEIVNIVKDEMDNPKGSTTEVEHHTKMLNESTVNEDARQYVVNKIRQVLTRFETLSEETVELYTKNIYSQFYGLGILQEIDDDEEVGEIMVNAYTYPTFRCDIYYIKNQVKMPYDKKFKDLDELMNVFSRAIAFSKKELNNVENAIVEATRSNRDRVNIIIPDASESYVMNIRKFGNFVPNLDMMYENGTVDDYIDRLLKVLVTGKANIGIGGPMGTGKTTFINFALTYTEKIERKVVVASVSETDVERVLKGHDILILNVDEVKGFTFERLLRTSLRTTADRVIIPESRGEEFKQVYEANLKTKGNMFTAHALDDYSFLDMCVDMYANGETVDVVNIRNKICKALDIIIIMRKVGNTIRIKSISEVVTDDKKQFDHMNLLYYWESDPEDMTKGRYRRSENRISEALRLRLNEYGVPMSELKDF